VLQGGNLLALRGSGRHNPWHNGGCGWNKKNCKEPTNGNCCQHTNSSLSHAVFGLPPLSDSIGKPDTVHAGGPNLNSNFSGIEPVRKAVLYNLPTMFQKRNTGSLVKLHDIRFAAGEVHRAAVQDTCRREDE
jgi:hypothetical protein